MKQVDWRGEYAKLSGELLGFCRGVVFWEIPEELIDKIVSFAEEKERRFNQLIEEYDERGNSGENNTIQY